MSLKTSVSQFGGSDSEAEESQRRNWGHNASNATRTAMERITEFNQRCDAVETGQSAAQHTNSTGQRSHPGATWEGTTTLNFATGFAGGAPYSANYKGVREGREDKDMVYGVGRTGKRRAEVPLEMVAEARKQNRKLRESRHEGWECNSLNDQEIYKKHEQSLTHAMSWIAQVPTLEEAGSQRVSPASTEPSSHEKVPFGGDWNRVGNRDNSLEDVENWVDEAGQGTMQQWFTADQPETTDAGIEHVAAQPKNHVYEEAVPEAVPATFTEIFFEEEVSPLWDSKSMRKGESTPKDADTWIKWEVEDGNHQTWCEFAGACLAVRQALVPDPNLLLPLGEKIDLGLPDAVPMIVEVCQRHLDTFLELVTGLERWRQPVGVEDRAHVVKRRAVVLDLVDDLIILSKAKLQVKGHKANVDLSPLVQWELDCLKKRLTDDQQIEEATDDGHYDLPEVRGQNLMDLESMEALADS